MFDSLSLEQKLAFESLNLGPVWLNNVSSEQALPITLAIIFPPDVQTQSDGQNRLIEQIFRAAKLAFNQAEVIEVSALKAGIQLETVVSFDAAQQINVLLEKQAVKITHRIDLPSLAAIATDGNVKAQAWEAVKAFLISQR